MAGRRITALSHDEETGEWSYPLPPAIDTAVQCVFDGVMRYVDQHGRWPGRIILPANWTETHWHILDMRLRQVDRRFEYEKTGPPGKMVML